MIVGRARMKWNLAIFGLFYHLFVPCIGRRANMREVAYIYDFGPCTGVPVKESIESSVNYRGTADDSIDVDITLNNSYTGLSASWDLYKCSSRELTDCESVLKFPVDDFCALFDNKDFWTKISEDFKPAIKCPMQGTYSLRNYPVAKAIPGIKKFIGVDLFSGAQTIYYCNLSLKHKSDTLVCQKVVGSFRLMRIKSKGKTNNSTTSAIK